MTALDKSASEYSETALGVLPMDWSVIKIGDNAVVSSGGTPSRNIPSYWNGEIPWITTSQIDFETIIHADEFITDVGLRKSPARMLDPGTILMATYGQGKTRGKVAILGIRAATNQACAAILFHDSIDPLFAFYFLSSRYDALRRLANSGNQENLSGALIKSALMAMPPISEQHAIATVLSDLDALLATIDTLINKKTDIKSEAIRQLLSGQVRLPEFSKISKGERPSPLGNVPAGWNVVPLGDLFDFKNGINKGKRHFGHGTPVVNYMDVYNATGMKSTDINGKVDATIAEISSYSAKRGDVFFTRTSETVDEIGVCSVLLDEVPDAVFSGFLLRAREKGQNIHNDFKRFCFSSVDVRRQIVAKSSYTTRALTNGRSLSSVTMLLPPPSEQEAIGGTLVEMDEEIDALKVERQKLRQLKQGVMQQLLTGRIRLV